MRAGRKRKIVERQPNGQPTRPAADPYLRMRNAGLLPMQAESQICAIYVICPELEARPIKIGMSVDPNKRLASLQTAHWSKLRIAKEIWLPSQQEAQVIEEQTHRRLKQRGLMLSGEWFDLDIEGASREVMHTLDIFREQARQIRKNRIDAINRR